MYFYDLQIHSIHSDGDWPPEKVFSLAQKNKLKGIVITDHNVIEAWSMIDELSNKFRIWTCQGVEISASFKKDDIHILGYSHNFKKDIIEEGLRETIEGYNTRTQAILSKLKDLDYTKLQFSDLEPRKNCYFKYDLARNIVNKEKKFSLAEIQKTINRGGLAFVPYGDWASKPWEAVDLIHKAGGIAVFAHPGEIRSDNPKEAQEKFSELFLILLEHNLNGIEVSYPTHSHKQEKYFRQLAKKHNLLITGGSDWHGRFSKPEIQMGQAGLTEEEFKNFCHYLS